MFYNINSNILLSHSIISKWPIINVKLSSVGGRLESWLVKARSILFGLRITCCSNLPMSLVPTSLTTTHLAYYTIKSLVDKSINDKYNFTTLFFILKLDDHSRTN